MRNTYELEDWEWRQIIRQRQLIREGRVRLMQVDLVAHAIVEQVITTIEHLDGQPPQLTERVGRV